MDEGEKQTAPAQELTGAGILASGLTLPEIWQTLHSNAREWREVPRNSRFFDLRDILDESDRQIYLMLREVDAVRWEQVCSGAGWTAIGAIALSWTRDGANFIRVAERWQLSGDTVDTGPRCLRTARQLDPRVRFQARKLSELVQELNGNVAHISLALAASAGEIKNDLEQVIIDTAPISIRQFLIS